MGQVAHSLVAFAAMTCPLNCVAQFSHQQPWAKWLTALWHLLPSSCEHPRLTAGAAHGQGRTCGSPCSSKGEAWYTHTTIDQACNSNSRSVVSSAYSHGRNASQPPAYALSLCGSSFFSLLTPELACMACPVKLVGALLSCHVACRCSHTWTLAWWHIVSKCRVHVPGAMPVAPSSMPQVGPAAWYRCTGIGEAGTASQHTATV